MKRVALVLILIAILCGQSIRPASALCLGCSCTVQSTPVTFPSYSFLTGATTSATISYNCSGGVGLTVAVQIALSAGRGTFAQRYMQVGTTGDKLDYALTTPLGQPFGDGTSGTSEYSSSSIFGILGTLLGGATVNGAIPSNQNVHSGNYTDSLVETISF